MLGATNVTRHEFYPESPQIFRATNNIQGVSRLAGTYSVGAWGSVVVKALRY